MNCMELRDMASEIEKDPRFQKITKSSRKYFREVIDSYEEDSDDAFMDVLCDENTSLSEAIDAAFEVSDKVDELSKKDEAFVLRLINGFKTLLAHI